MVCISVWLIKAVRRQSGRQSGVDNQPRAGGGAFKGFPSGHGAILPAIMARLERPPARNPRFGLYLRLQAKENSLQGMRPIYPGYQGHGHLVKSNPLWTPLTAPVALLQKKDF